MQKYDFSQPIIFIHIPKTAGTSVLEIFKQWFGNGLLLHYYKEQLCEMPVHHDIFSKHSVSQPVVVYGHFNRRRSFGVEDYYPQAKQFITILRDPLERLISNYFYIKKVAHGWRKYPQPLDADLGNYVRDNKSVMLNYFPREVTFDNYKEIIEKYFVEIGVVEEIELTMVRIAKALGMPYCAEMLECINATSRDQAISEELRNVFIEENELEYYVFNYIKENLMKNVMMDLPGVS